MCVYLCVCGKRECVYAYVCLCLCARACVCLRVCMRVRILWQPHPIRYISPRNTTVVYIHTHTHLCDEGQSSEWLKGRWGASTVTDSSLLSFALNSTWTDWTPFPTSSCTAAAAPGELTVLRSTRPPAHYFFLLRPFRRGAEQTWKKHRNSRHKGPAEARIAAEAEVVPWWEATVPSPTRVCVIVAIVTYARPTNSATPEVRSAPKHPDKVCYTPRRGTQHTREIRPPNPAQVALRRSISFSLYLSSTRSPFLTTFEIQTSWFVFCYGSKAEELAEQW